MLMYLCGLTDVFKKFYCYTYLKIIIKTKITANIENKKITEKHECTDKSTAMLSQLVKNEKIFKKLITPVWLILVVLFLILIKFVFSI